MNSAKTGRIIRIVVTVLLILLILVSRSVWHGCAQHETDGDL